MTTSNCKNDEQRSWKIAGNTATLLGRPKGQLLEHQCCFFVHLPSSCNRLRRCDAKYQRHSAASATGKHFFIILISKSSSTHKTGQMGPAAKLANVLDVLAQVIRPRPGKWKYVSTLGFSFLGPWVSQ